MTSSQRLTRAAIIACLTMLLAGCEAWRPLSPLSTAASMRVEVEVYKGPLVQPVASQYAELTGALIEARKAFNDWSTLATFAHSDRDLCPEPLLKGSQEGEGSDENRSEELDTSSNHERDKCRQLEEATYQAKEIVQALDFLLCAGRDNQRCLAVKKGHHVLIGIASKPQDEQRRFLAGAIEIAARMRAKAFYSTYDQLPSLPHQKLRAVLWGWTTLASSYANELNGRATALLKQMEVDGASTPIKGHHLSVGDHLKNANPSDFLHLMDWYNTVHRWQARADGLSEADRVRTGQRLFGDHYWSKVNEVQANGQGNVRMAFIRDAIGNWNLRSFDNDPKELMEAYREITKAGVALATKVTTGGADPAAALGVANQMINNQLGSAGVAAASNKEISALRRRLIKDIEQAREDLKEAKTLPEALSSHQREARESFDNAQGSVDEKEREVASLEEQLAALQDDDAEQRTNLETRHTSAKAELELAKRQRDQSKAALDEIDKQVAAVVGSKVKQVLDGVKADLRSHLDIIDGLKAAEVADNESKPVQPLKTITNGGEPDPPS